LLPALNIPKPHIPARKAGSWSEAWLKARIEGGDFVRGLAAPGGRWGWSKASLNARRGGPRPGSKPGGGGVVRDLELLTPGPGQNPKASQTSARSPKLHLGFHNGFQESPDP